MKRINVIRSYYDDNMQRSEKDHEILGWESKEAQYERFAALADNVDLEGKKLLDVGCGLGNLLEYLNEKKASKTNCEIVDVTVDSEDLASILEQADTEKK